MPARRNAPHAPWRALTATLAALALTVAACTGAGAPAVATPSAISAPAASVAPSDTPMATISGGGGRGDYGYETEATPAGSASGATDSATVQVNTATGAVGTYLTGKDGLTLYTFKPDGANTSTCSGRCAGSWPPLTFGADATLEAGDGVTGALTTFARDDGSMQVAYDGAPLYYFASDTAAGDTNGQGLGDAWFVAKP